MSKRRNKNKKAGPVKIIRPADLNPSPAAEAPASEAAEVEDVSASTVDQASEAVGAVEAQAGQDEFAAAPEVAEESAEPEVAAAEAQVELTEGGESVAVEMADAVEHETTAATADQDESPEAQPSHESVETSESAEPAVAEQDAEPLPEFEDASALLAQSVPVEAQDDVAARQIESIPIEAAQAADEAPAMAADAEAAQAVEAPAEQRQGGGGKNRKDRKLKLNKLQKHARSDLEPLSEAQPVVAPEPEPEPEPAAPVEAERVGPSEPRIAAFAKLSEYQTLSLAHVAGIPEEADLPGHWRGVGFAISGRRLVTAFDEVVEIIRVPQITHVPGTQHWMLGVANVRGTLLPVVDLKQFLEGERTVMYEGQRVMVVRQSGGNVAVLIDQLYGQRAFNDSQKVVADADSDTRFGHFIKQFYRVGDNDWGVFSMSMLTRTPEFRQAAA